MKILFIYGAGGDGREVFDLVQRNSNIVSNYNKVFFLDDNIDNKEFYGTKLVNTSITSDN